MPGRGKLERRPFTESERHALGESVDTLGPACHVYLNEGTYWACVPERAWEFKIGGFQVLKKWLSYREHGRGTPASSAEGSPSPSPASSRRSRTG